MYDDEDLVAIWDEHASTQLAILASRLATPEAAWDRFFQWWTALLRVVPAGRADLWQLHDLAARLTCRELIAAL